jgi:hypothetical protein
VIIARPQDYCSVKNVQQNLDSRRLPFESAGRLKVSPSWSAQGPLHGWQNWGVPEHFPPNSLEKQKPWTKREQRPVFNVMVCPQGWTSSPRGELCPLGVMFTPSFTPRIEGRTENFTPGDNFTPTRGQNSTPGTISPLGGGQSLPIGAKLIMGLRHPTGDSGEVGRSEYEWSIF